MNLVLIIACFLMLITIVFLATYLISVKKKTNSKISTLQEEFQTSVKRYKETKEYSQELEDELRLVKNIYRNKLLKTINKDVAQYN